MREAPRGILQVGHRNSGIEDLRRAQRMLGWRGPARQAVTTFFPRTVVLDTNLDASIWNL